VYSGAVKDCYNHAQYYAQRSAGIKPKKGHIYQLFDNLDTAWKELQKLKEAEMIREVDTALWVEKELGIKGEVLT